MCKYIQYRFLEHYSISVKIIGLYEAGYKKLRTLWDRKTETLWTKKYEEGDTNSLHDHRKNKTSTEDNI